MIAAEKKETPPRAWGRLAGLDLGDQALGNTPTGVGKTASGYVVGQGLQKHPHGRGEDLLPAINDPRGKETPPRAWGRRHIVAGTDQRVRNTPTGVGKTRKPPTPDCSVQKHPHGRGEDVTVASPANQQRETPPRAWGRQKAEKANKANAGNTPTGVGKTTHA